MKAAYAKNFNIYLVGNNFLFSAAAWQRSLFIYV